MGVAVVDLREVAHGLSPDHLPGERLEVELIKEGRQPRQAIGYLPDGDMVVVNDATHLVGSGHGRRHRALDPAHQPGDHGLRQAGRSDQDGGHASSATSI